MTNKKVEIYSKKDCHLCDEAKTILKKIKNKIPFNLIEVNIESSEKLLEKYKLEIPVVFIDGRKAFKFQVNEKLLIRKLTD